MSPTISVAVIHHEAIVGESIAAALAGHAGLRVVGRATSATEGLRLGAQADVAVIHEGLTGAIVCARRLHSLGVRVILLGQRRTHSPHGYETVSIDASLHELETIIVPGTNTGKDVIQGLTGRERQIISLVAEGLAGKQVARVLGISPKTVERHKTRIFSKLGVPNQAAAVGLVARHLDHGEINWNLSSM
jgi:DNA-binding NarL/FixJ family response regulator